MHYEKPRLLVVDDEIEVTKSLKRQLRKKYDVLTANSAEEGLSLLQNNDIQAIISDQRMPTMTGSEFFRAIKDEYPVATRILMTAYSDINSIIEAINHGNIYRYVVKPYDLVELEGVIEQSIELSKQKRLSMARTDDMQAELESEVSRFNHDLAETCEKLKASNEKLTRLSNKDEVTKLYNRRYFNKQLSKTHHHFLRHHCAHTLMLLDLDFFKKINDTYGHLVGDKVLTQFAERLLACCRDIDVVCRIGGEEFAVICTETKMSEALVIAERIRKSIAENVFKIDTNRIPLTVSIGVSEVDSAMSMSQWIKKADEKLYLAKRQGRNQYCS